MHFFIYSSTLLNKLYFLNEINKKKLYFKNIYFILEINKKKLIITSFSNTEDYSIHVYTDIYIYVKENTREKVIIDSKLFTEILSTFTKEIISIKKDNDTLNISSLQGSFKIPILRKKLNLIRGDLFCNNNTIFIFSNLLLKILEKIIFSIGNVKFKTILNGVYFQFSPYESYFISTNNLVLVKYTVKYIKSNKNIKFIVPRNSIYILHKILKYEKNSNNNVYIKYNSKENYVIFLSKNYIFSSKILNIDNKKNKKQQNYNSIIPTKKFDVLLIINRVLFLNTIKRLLILSKLLENKKIEKFIYLQIINNEFSIFNRKNFSLKIKCKSIYNSLQKIKMGFNCKFLIEILSHLDNDFIYFELYNSNKIGVLKTNFYKNKKEMEFISILIMSIIV
ncbi:DNA polymerase III subunit beta family protein [Blattabacterium cuenoti]|uniref:DNA polymerase III subunit beta family protein n=1 Tax=Blattabacterium cuenoti TaxID=1653831 RepID=UPI00163C10DA|nr:DNA polymerase III subunit beta [Blattabacterium cuenoti]